MRLLASKFVVALRREGLGATLRKGLRHLSRGRRPDEFDLRRGTDTGGLEPLWRLKIRSPNAQYGVRYQATDERELVEAINFLEVEPHKLTFIDLGCGKGRALLVASEIGFGEVVGVEFASELVDIATANLAKMRITEARVVHADAGDFEFPTTDMVVYLYNPFSKEVLQRVLANLQKCGCAARYVIYKAPRCAELLDLCGFLSRVGCPPGITDLQIWRAINQDKSEGSQLRDSRVL